MEGKVNRNYKQRIQWTDYHEEILISLWAEKIPELRGQRKNRGIMKEIAARLRYEGCEVTAVEVKTKIHNLTAKYRIEKASPHTSKWRFFNRIQKIIDTLKIRKESLTEDTIEDVKLEIIDELSHCEEQSEEGITLNKPLNQHDDALEYPVHISRLAEEPTFRPPSPDSFPSTSSKRKRKISFNGEIINMIRKVEQQMEEQIEDQRKYDKQIYELEVNRTKLLKEFVDTTKELKNAFVNYLKKT